MFSTRAIASVKFKHLHYKSGRAVLFYLIDNKTFFGIEICLSDRSGYPFCFSFKKIAANSATTMSEHAWRTYLQYQQMIVAVGNGGQAQKVLRF